jgi:hypothetical protein
MGHALRVTEAGGPHRSRDARCVKGWGRLPPHPKFGRVLHGFLFKGYLCCFLQVRVTAKVKRIKAMGEAPG